VTARPAKQEEGHLPVAETGVPAARIALWIALGALIVFGIVSYFRYQPDIIHFFGTAASQ